MEELPHDACLGFLKRHRFGTMAFADGRRAYAIPLFYAFDGKRLYFQSHPGEKDKFIATTAEACFLVTEVAGDDDWASVQAFGPIEKVTLSDDAFAAMDAMARNPFPPEYRKEDRLEPRRSSARMFLWMLKPNRIVGRKSRTK